MKLPTASLDGWSDMGDLTLPLAGGILFFF